MKKVGSIYYKALERISPSQFTSMKNCSYKSILAHAFNKQPLLPISPAAYFGTVMHHVLERIAKENICDEETFQAVFTEELNRVEGRLNNEGYNFLVPLQKSVNNFGLRKVQLKTHIRTKSENREPVSNLRSHSEKWISTMDGLVGGYVDLVFESDSYTEFLDFKTGAITHDVLDDEGELHAEIKTEYSDQLKLYAYAYYETKGRYPDKLSLIDLTKQKFDVKFDHADCKELYLSARALLSVVNHSIETKEFDASTSQDNCQNCLYRPSCDFYKTYALNNPPLNDVVGILDKMVSHLNGNITLHVKNNSGSYLVTAVSKREKDELEARLGKEIGIYNLKKESRENVFSSKKTTVIYEQ